MAVGNLEPYQQLEIEWAEYNDLDPANMVACSSGTAALHLALECVGAKANGVVVPDYTMVACARAVTLADMEPTFIDCRSDLLADWSLMADMVDGCVPAYVQRRNQGVLMVVHIYGRRSPFPVWRPDPDGFQDGPLRYVEDLAEAHGVKPYPETDAACWSFYKNKIVAGEEGGAVWFKDQDHAKLARQLRSLGFTDAHDFQHMPRGHNYRLANCLAEKVLDDLEWADPRRSMARHNSVVLRREIESWYDVACLDEWRMPPRDAPWVYDLRIPGLTRQKMGELVRALNGVGIAARHGFWPMSMQKEYQDCELVEAGDHEAGKSFDEVFYLPIQPGITSKESVIKSFEVIQSMVGK